MPETEGIGARLPHPMGCGKGGFASFWDERRGGATLCLHIFAFETDGLTDGIRPRSLVFVFRCLVFSCATRAYALRPPGFDFQSAIAV